MKQSLFLNDVKIYVSLGCSGEE
ncbi:dihydroneopterin aldolase, partial [Francisella tularensis subsp. holarctica]|nr:dihydroneopterin aldolase [Francisella tularensis subsp. holarctica]